MKEISLDLFREGDRKEPFVRQEQQENSLMESRIALEKTVIERERLHFELSQKASGSTNSQYLTTFPIRKG
jgi:hypothetical protein